MYRGWYKGERSFGSARVPWEFCLAEWNAQFLGDRAYRITDMEKANLRWEAAQFGAGRLWNRWDYPNELGSRRFEDRNVVLAMYLAENWRAYRTWGVSGISPWEFGNYWSPRAGVERRRRALAVDWDHLQRPGFSPDYIAEQYERFDLAFAQSDWIPNAAGKALLRNNQPLLAYLGGKPSRFTSKDHIFRPGETVEKQIVVVNNSRETVSCACDWRLELPTGEMTGRKQLEIATGQQERLPLSFTIPHSVASGTHRLGLSVRFNTGEIQEDSFAVHVLDRPSPLPKSPIALFDPKGETGRLLAAMGVPIQPVEADADVSRFECLVVGKSALTLDGPAPGIERVRDGLRVLVFEQAAEVLERRLGFRVAEYGSRRVFPRVADHPLLKGIGANHLRDWRGAATLLPSRLRYTLRPGHGPTVTWCGIPVSRVWRCGNQGNVASVVLEKPACGDFLPIVDCGFGLQYSPLLQYREGKGLILFCQLDVTGRSEPEPAAETLVRNLLGYLSSWQPTPGRTVVYAGDRAGLAHLKTAGLDANAFDPSRLGEADILVVGRGGEADLKPMSSALAVWLRRGGELFAIGLDESAMRDILPFPVRTERKEHIAAYFDALGASSPLAGIAPADVHDRDARKRPLLSSGVTAFGDDVLGRVPGSNVVFFQMVPWEYDRSAAQNVKRTFRRTSCLLSRVLGNLGAVSSTPLLARFSKPVSIAGSERRWENGLYLDLPDEFDDPYRFFRW
jgi:hypothetical protein